MLKNIDWFNVDEKNHEINVNHKHHNLTYNIKILSLDNHIIDEGIINSRMFLIKSKKKKYWKLVLIQLMNHIIDEGQILYCNWKKGIYIDIDDNDEYSIAFIKSKPADKSTDEAFED